MNTQALVPLQTQAPIFLCQQETDMRLGLPGLFKLVKQEAHRDPYKLGLYVFVNKDRKRLKLFWYDKTGFAYFYKFTPKHVFQVSHEKNGFAKITGVNLRELLKGVPKKLGKTV